MPNGLFCKVMGVRWSAERLFLMLWSRLQYFETCCLRARRFSILQKIIVKIFYFEKCINIHFQSQFMFFVIPYGECPAVVCGGCV